MSYPYFGYPPPPPGYYMPPPQQASVSDLVGMLEGVEKTKKALQEILKEKKPEKKEKTYNQKQMLAFMALGALPIGMAQLAILLVTLNILAKAVGVIH